MNITMILLAVLVLINLVILVRSFFKSASAPADYQQTYKLIDSKMNDFAKILGGGLSDNRREYGLNFKEFRKELGELFSRFSVTMEQKTEGLFSMTLKNLRENREEMSASLGSFEEKFTRTVAELTKSTSEKLESIRGGVDRKLESIQKDNNEKLEEMRRTVDEKLHSTLEKRLGESFRLVSDRLESVQKGLGEMQSLASGVGDLKKVLSNVKSRGVIGEYQLEALLEQLLSRQQYEKNVKTKKGGRENVEFAIKIPDKNTEDSFIWLPIDAKFPTGDYERLQNAYEAADRSQVEESVKALASRIEKFARDIHEKYVDPPHTTDFAVMFLPFEGLYAEVLRIPGLFEKIQNTYKVTITGPTTVSALLNSLQMGFRTLAIEKRSVEVWQVLGAVKTEFGKFGMVIEQAKKKLDAARDELEKTDTRTRKINSKLKDIETLPENEAVRMIGNGDTVEENE
ncbi:MAG TPA: DNA recombination protein RmuC [Spirochaetota bacterium]|nr:DNA recombination protein RmuC [Spirochaetota bacterium]HSA16284.1 DNA recombination protein RmuC [Spirochaetota bacterium]